MWQRLHLVRITTKHWFTRLLRLTSRVAAPAPRPRRTAQTFAVAVPSPGARKVPVVHAPERFAARFLLVAAEHLLPSRGISTRRSTRRCIALLCARYSVS